MRKTKIVADTSCDLLSLKHVAFACAPMKIITSEREFVDDESLDVNEMVEYLDKYKGKSKSSCPNTVDWLDAFGDADDIFCFTITSSLSGSYNSACAAKQIYESENEGKRVLVIDTLSTGPEIALAIEKAVSCTRVAVAVIGLEVPHVHIHLIPIHRESDLNFAQKKEVEAEEMAKIAKAIAEQF